MRNDIESLLRTQHHDQKIRSLEKEIAGIPLEEEDIRDKLSADEAALEKARAALQRVEVEIKNLELDVETRRDSISKLKVQQYETKKNEEYRKMGGEIDRYEKEISELEDREIDLMEEAETQKKALAEARESYAENEGSVKEELEDLESLHKNLLAQVEEEKEKRAEQAGNVDGDLLEIYDRLFKAKNGLAVVGLVDEVCQGCHMRVTKSTIMEVKSEKQLASCENCGRLLYWWTDDSVGKNRGEY